VKRIVFAIAFVLLLQSALAAIVNEKTVSDAGYAEFAVQGVDKNACTEIAFAKDLNQNTAGFYTVFSLHAEFLPVVSGDATASVFLNGDENALETAKATDFENKWHRFILPNQNLKEQNALKVCLQTSNTVVEARLLADSIIGTYKMPEFKKELFVKSVDNQAPLIGEEFEVTIKLTNSGSEATDVNILHRKPEVTSEYTQVLRGQSTYFNIIKPGETVTLTYSTKSRKAGPLALPAAVAYYTNVFGEQKRIVSNYPLLEIKVPEIKVKALFLLKEAVKKTGETTSARLAIKNEGENTLYNITSYLQFPAGISLVNGNSSETISTLKPKETKFFDLNISAGIPGDYSLGCKLAYIDYNVTETVCENAKISFEENKIPAEIIFAAAIVAFAMLVYAFFHFKK